MCINQIYEKEIEKEKKNQMNKNEPKKKQN